MNDPGLYLLHMLEAARRIQEYTSSGREDFVGSEMIQDAVIRNFELMGEAANRLPGAFREAHPEIGWRRIINFRNVLIHGYEHLVLERIWAVIADELPGVVAPLEVLVRDLGIDSREVP